MSNHNGNETCSSRQAGVQKQQERLRDGLLDALGGQDLRNSGFESESPDPEFNMEDEPWRE
jgi:hypothetical protein